MKCPKCSREVASGTAMCPTCGTFISESRPAARAETAAPVAAPVKSHRNLFIAAGALLAVIIVALLLAILLKQGNVTGAEQPNPVPGPAVTNAPPPVPVPGPAVTGAPAPVPPAPAPGEPTKPPPPKELVDYLDFVKQIEARRQALLKDTGRAVAMAAGEAQADSLMEMMDMVMNDSPKAERPKKANAVQKELGAHLQNWQQLIQAFDSRPAPQQCTQFAGNYRMVLTTETTGIGTVANVVSNVNWSDYESVKKALSDLQTLKADPNLQGGIDKSVETADQELTTVCSNYDMKKPFDVNKETGGGVSIMGGL